MRITLSSRKIILLFFSVILLQFAIVYYIYIWIAVKESNSIHSSIDSSLWDAIRRDALGNSEETVLHFEDYQHFQTQTLDYQNLLIKLYHKQLDFLDSPSVCFSPVSFMLASDYLIEKSEQELQFYFQGSSVWKPIKSNFIFSQKHIQTENSLYMVYGAEHSISFTLIETLLSQLLDSSYLILYSKPNHQLTLSESIRANTLFRNIKENSKILFLQNSSIDMKPFQNKFSKFFVFRCTEESVLFSTANPLETQIKGKRIQFALPTQLIGQFIFPSEWIDLNASISTTVSSIINTSFENYHSAEKIVTKLLYTIQQSQLMESEKLWDDSTVASSSEITKYKQSIFNYLYPKELLLTSFFTNSIDEATESKMETWIESVERLQMNGIIFFNNISQSLLHSYSSQWIRFIPCQLGARSFLEERFLCYQNYLLLLQQHVPFSNLVTKVIMTDLFDVVFFNNPFRFMETVASQHAKLFVATERIYCTRRLVSSVSFFRQEAKVCLHHLYDSIHQFLKPERLFNAGIIGGDLTTVLTLLSKMNEMILNTSVDSTCDMIILNYVVNLFFSNSYFTGEPFHSPFKKFSLNSTYYIKHK